VVVVAALGPVRAVRAQGGPQLETDDPGTPGPGRLELKLKVPWRVATAAAQPAMTGVGNIELGAKWRLVDGPVAVSTYLQAAIARSESARDKGIAESETEILLPIEIAWETGPVALNLEVGYQHAASSDEVE